MANLPRSRTTVVAMGVSAAPLDCDVSLAPEERREASVRYPLRVSLDAYSTYNDILEEMDPTI